MISSYGDQDLVVVFIVLAAALWLTRRWWLRRKRGSCTCDGCPVAEQDAKAAPPVAAMTDSGLLTIEPKGDGLLTIEAPRESR